jgi:hypothetical protein
MIFVKDLLFSLKEERFYLLVMAKPKANASYGKNPKPKDSYCKNTKQKAIYFKNKPTQAR